MKKSLINNKILITGASSGIGKALALHFADKASEVTLILIARNKEKLIETAETCMNKGIQTYYFIADLALPDESEKICYEIKHKIGIPDIIINNAGGGQFKAMKDARITDALQAMGAPYFSSFHLTCYFFNDFCKRNTGNILFVNTPAAYFPFPFTLTYSSTRWALRAMIRCLRQELKGTQILVSEVIPGLTISNYFANNNMQEDQHIPAINSYLFKKLSSEEVATSIYQGILQNKKLIVPQKLMRIILPLSQIFPTFFDKILMWKKPK